MLGSIKCRGPVAKTCCLQVVCKVNSEGLIQMTEIRLETVENNSSTIGPPAGIKPMPL